MRCFWCCDVLKEGDVVRCPVRYNPPQQFRVYHKTFADAPKKFGKPPNAKPTFSINENIPSTVSRPGVFDEHGYFCSNGCCLAFARDKKGADARYKNACIFIRTYYKGPPAPHYELLKDFGGTLTRYQFRKKMGDAPNPIGFLSHHDGTDVAVGDLAAVDGIVAKAY